MARKRDSARPPSRPPALLPSRPPRRRSGASLPTALEPGPLPTSACSSRSRRRGRHGHAPSSRQAGPYQPARRNRAAGEGVGGKGAAICLGPAENRRLRSRLRLSRRTGEAARPEAGRREASRPPSRRSPRPRKWLIPPSAGAGRPRRCWRGGEDEAEAARRGPAGSPRRRQWGAG